MSHPTPTSSQQESNTGRDYGLRWQFTESKQQWNKNHTVTAAVLITKVCKAEGAASYLCLPLSEPCLRGMGRDRWQQQRDRVRSVDPKSLQHYHSWQLPRGGEGTNRCTSSVYSPFSFPWNHSPHQWSQRPGRAHTVLSSAHSLRPRHQAQKILNKY